MDPSQLPGQVPYINPTARELFERTDSTARDLQSALASAASPPEFEAIQPFFRLVHQDLVKVLIAIRQAPERFVQRGLRMTQLAWEQNPPNGCAEALAEVLTLVLVIRPLLDARIEGTEILAGDLPLYPQLEDLHNLSEILNNPPPLNVPFGGPRAPMDLGPCHQVGANGFFIAIPNRGAALAGPSAAPMNVVGPAVSNANIAPAEQQEHGSGAQGPEATQQEVAGMEGIIDQLGNNADAEEEYQHGWLLNMLGDVVVEEEEEEEEVQEEEDNSDRLEELGSFYATTEDKRETCCVCLTEYEEGENLRKLPCAHKFHAECIDPWLKRHNSCPEDRAKVFEKRNAQPQAQPPGDGE